MLSKSNPLDWTSRESKSRQNPATVRPLRALAGIAGIPKRVVPRFDVLPRRDMTAPESSRGTSPKRTLGGFDSFAVEPARPAWRGGFRYPCETRIAEPGTRAGDIDQGR